MAAPTVPTMKAVVLDTEKGFFVKEGVAVPQPGPGEVCVKVHAAALNPVDYKYDLWGGMCEGGKPTGDFRSGCDGAGVVHALGEGVTSRKVGDRVNFHTWVSWGNGSFAEFAIVKELACVPLADSVTFEDAAAVPCAGWTAYECIVDKLQAQLVPEKLRKARALLETAAGGGGAAGEAKAGEGGAGCPPSSILVTGAAGGVGSFAVQLAKHFGFEVIIGTCSAKNFDAVKALGATHVVDYHDDDAWEQIKKASGGDGVFCAVDTVSEESATAALDVLRYNGAIVAIAGSSVKTDQATRFRALAVHNVLLGVRLITSPFDVADIGRIGREFGALLESGAIRANVSETITLDDIPAALERLKARHVAGKIVARIA